MVDADVVGEPPGVPGHREHHREVLGLGRTDDVDQPVGAELLDAMAQRGQIGRGITEAAILLAHDQGEGIAVTTREAGREGA